jgi:hypothetical protein
VNCSVHPQAGGAPVRRELQRVQRWHRCRAVAPAQLRMQIGAFQNRSPCWNTENECLCNRSCSFATPSWHPTLTLPRPFPFRARDDRLDQFLPFIRTARFVGLDLLRFQVSRQCLSPENGRANRRSQESLLTLSPLWRESAVVAARRCSTLVLVHRSSLLDQGIAQLSVFLGAQTIPLRRRCSASFGIGVRLRSD